MKYLKIFIALISFAIITASCTTNNKAVVESSKSTEIEKVAETLKWTNNFEKANAESQKTGKPIFAFFTGSDWCGWCKRLQATVFRKPEFITWANKNVILLELDFPRRTKLDPKIAQQNRQLQQLFKVRGYPTIHIFNAKKNSKTGQMQIEQLGQLGYPQGATKGKEQVKFIADANRVLANKKK